MQMANRQLWKPGDSVDDIVIYLTAPTGTAAYNINGCTIHSSFSSFMLPVHGSYQSRSLSAEKLSQLCVQFNKLAIIVIDEISMVDANILSSLHDRLAAITM